MGEGDPGGACIRCPKAEFPGGGRPECALLNHLACWDHNLNSLYIFEIKRKQVTMYNDYKGILCGGDSIRYPHMMVTEISLDRGHQQGNIFWHHPIFRTIDIVEVELFKKLREMRTELANALNAVQSSGSDDDHSNGDDMGNCPI
jgi:hypothetical protein